MCSSKCNTSPLKFLPNQYQMCLSHSPHILLISMGMRTTACASVGLYLHQYAENLRILNVWSILYEGVKERASQSEALENGQPGGGQGTGVDVLGVGHSVQGRF